MSASVEVGAAQEMKLTKCRVLGGSFFPARLALSVVVSVMLLFISELGLAEGGLPAVSINSPKASGWETSSLNVNDDKISPPVDEGTYSRGLKVNENDITPEQDESNIALTSEQLHQAAVWGLKPEEEQRYVFLMQNKSGVFYAGKNLSPVWILGLNARTDSERTYYATLASKQEEQYIVQNLAWETAFHQAYHSLTADLPVVKPFDVSPYSPLTHEAVTFQPHDVVNFFINPTAPVGNALTTLLVAQKKEPILRLNLFFIGHPDNEALQAWANHQSLPLEWVKSGRITLNQGDALFNSIALPQKRVPLILLVRGGQSIPLDAGVL